MATIPDKELARLRDELAKEREQHARTGYLLGAVTSISPDSAFDVEANTLRAAALSAIEHNGWLNPTAVSQLRADVTEVSEALNDERAENERAHLRLAQLEKDLALAHERAATLADALRRIALGSHEREDNPAKPSHWDVKLTCERCGSIGQDIDALDRNHQADCPTKIARAALASPATPEPCRLFDNCVLGRGHGGQCDSNLATPDVEPAKCLCDIACPPGEFDPRCEHPKHKRKPFPVTNPEDDAPDGAEVDGFVRVGSTWEPKPETPEPREDIEGLRYRIQTLKGERAEVDRQIAALTKERDEARAEETALHDLVSRQAELLTGVVNALRGAPPPDTMYSHHDAPERARAVVKERDEANAYAKHLEEGCASTTCGRCARCFESMSGMASIYRNERDDLRAKLERATALLSVAAQTDFAGSEGWRERIAEVLYTLSTSPTPAAKGGSIFPEFKMDPTIPAGTVRFVDEKGNTVWQIVNVCCCNAVPAERCPVHEPK
jgi:hypothetical protein